MKLPIRVIKEIRSELDPIPFIFLIISIWIGLGFIHQALIFLRNDLTFQFFLYFFFLEAGSQIFEIFKCQRNNFREEKFSERYAYLIVSVLFFSIGIIPLSKILFGGGVNLELTYGLMVPSLLIILRRNIGTKPVHQIISIFIFAVNNAFFIPQSQLAIYNVKISSGFLLISQSIFFLYLGFLIIKEIYQMEIEDKWSPIVFSLGTLPLLRIAYFSSAIGLMLILIFAFGQKKPGILMFTFPTYAISILQLIILKNLNRIGRKALINLFWTFGIQLFFFVLGIGMCLWIN